MAEILEDVGEDTKSKYYLNLGVLVVFTPIAVHLAALPHFTKMLCFFSVLWGIANRFATYLLCSTQGDPVGKGD